MYTTVGVSPNAAQLTAAEELTSSDSSPSPPVSVKPSLEAIIEASPMVEVKPLPGVTESSMITEQSATYNASDRQHNNTEDAMLKLAMTSHRTRILLSPAKKNTIIENSLQPNVFESEDNVYNTLEEPSEYKHYCHEMAAVNINQPPDDSTVISPSPIYEVIDDTLERKLQKISEQNQVEANIIQVSVVESDLDNDEPPQVFSYYTLASSQPRGSHLHCCGSVTEPNSRRSSNVSHLAAQPRRSHSLTPTFGRKMDSKFDHQAALRKLTRYAQRAPATAAGAETRTDEMTLSASVPKVKRHFSLNLQKPLLGEVANEYQRSPSCPMLPTRNPGMIVPEDNEKCTRPYSYLS